MNVRRFGAGALTGLLAVLCALAVTCARQPALPPSDQVYTVRGEVTGLPRPDRPASELTIHHEPIAAFVNKDGKVVGMDSMEMPFTPARGVSLIGLDVGDKIEFTFEVRWKQSPYFQVTRITKLSRDTALDWGKAPRAGS